MRERAPDSLSAKVGRRLGLLSLVLKRPLEVRDQVAKDLETAADRLGKRPAGYESMTWPAALAELAQLYPEAVTIAAEPDLRGFESQMRERLAELERQGHRDLVFNCDVALARCVYIVCRALRPEVVVETGVAYGLSSAFILKALSVNGRGTLYSIDLPPLGDGSDHVGLLVPDGLKSKWQLLRGTSREHLPPVVRDRSIDVFLHDSLHTYRTMQWEFGVAWPRLRDGGALLSDDVQGNNAFAEIRPKAKFSRVIREDQKAVLFGIAIK